MIFRRTRRPFLRDRFARQFSECLGCGNFHLVIDRGRTHIERATEYERKAKDIIDLVREVRTASGNDRVRALGRRFGWPDFRVRIRHGEDDRLPCHRLYHLGLERTRGGQAKEHVGANQSVGEAPHLSVSTA